MGVTHGAGAGKKRWSPRGSQVHCGGPWSVGDGCRALMGETIDIETVPVQGVGAQQGNAMGQLAQLPVQLLSVESQAFRVRAMHTHGIHSGGCPILLRPEGSQSTA